MSRIRKLAMWSGAAAATGAAGFVAHALPGLTALPVVRTRAFPKLSGYGRPGHVALSFDDGPGPVSTPAFLEELDRLGWHATFFMLGVMVDRDPGLAREVAAAGHEIALHGYEHRNHLWRGPSAVLGDVRRGFDAVAQATGTVPSLFRPPYGVLTSAGLMSARLVGLRPVLWSAWGKDWSTDVTPETVFHHLRRGVEGGRAGPGPTLLLHDSDCTTEIAAWRAALGALPLLAELIEERGWIAGPLRDHGIDEVPVGRRAG